MLDSKFTIESAFQDDLSLFFVILSLTLIGSFVKDIFTRSTRKPKIWKTYSAALVVSILIFSFSEWIFKYFPGRTFLAVCIVSGLISVEITSRLTTIDGIKKFISDLIEFIQKKK